MGVHLWDKYNKLRVSGSTILDAFEPRRARYSMASTLWHVKKKSVSTAGAIVAIHLTGVCALAPCHVMLLVSPYTVQRLALIILGSLRVGSAMQSLDKSLTDCKDETHVKSFHDAPDKVSFKAQARPCPSILSSVMPAQQ